MCSEAELFMHAGMSSAADTLTEELKSLSKTRVLDR